MAQWVSQWTVFTGKLSPGMAWMGWMYVSLTPGTTRAPLAVLITPCRIAPFPGRTCQMYFSGIVNCIPCGPNFGMDFGKDRLVPFPGRTSAKSLSVFLLHCTLMLVLTFELRALTTLSPFFCPLWQSFLLIVSTVGEGSGHFFKAIVRLKLAKHCAVDNLFYISVCCQWSTYVDAESAVEWGIVNGNALIDGRLPPMLIAARQTLMILSS